MNYNPDRDLESQLRLFLDPIVKAPVPPRKSRRTLRDECQVLQPTLVVPVVPEPVEAFA